MGDHLVNDIQCHEMVSNEHNPNSQPYYHNYSQNNKSHPPDCNPREIPRHHSIYCMFMGMLVAYVISSRTE